MYYATNESLDAIVKGLDLQPTDEVLAICGSGDQAFAMLEHVDKVIAIDYDPAQIKYAKKRKLALQDGDINKFIFPVSQIHIVEELVEEFPARCEYFQDPERIRKIQAKLHKIEFLERDIRNIIPNQFSPQKLYLSHANQDGCLTSIENSFREYSGLISIGDLIYTAWGWVSPVIDGICGETLEVEEDLTKAAREFETEWKQGGGYNWDLHVFKKIA